MSDRARASFGLRSAALPAGGVPDAAGAARRHDEDARSRATRTWTRTRRIPIHGLEEALGLKRPKIPLIVLCGAIAGACIAYSLIYFCNVFDWPLNIGNRPPHGPPANIPITFELAVLLGGGSSFFGFFALAKLPQPYHPVFESEEFQRASVDAFFLSVEMPARDRRGPRAGRHARRRRDRRPRSSRSPSDDRADALKLPLAAALVAARRPACIDENILEQMADSQPKANRYRESEFYADGLTMRAPPEGTVPRERITLNPR